MGNRIYSSRPPGLAPTMNAQGQYIDPMTGLPTTPGAVGFDPYTSPAAMGTPNVDHFVPSAASENGPVDLNNIPEGKALVIAGEVMVPFMGAYTQAPRGESLTIPVNSGWNVVLHTAEDGNVYLSKQEVQHPRPEGKPKKARGNAGEASPKKGRAKKEAPPAADPTALKPQDISQVKVGRLPFWQDFVQLGGVGAWLQAPAAGQTTRVPIGNYQVVLTTSADGRFVDVSSLNLIAERARRLAEAQKTSPSPSVQGAPVAPQIAVAPSLGQRMVDIPGLGQVLAPPAGEACTYALNGVDAIEVRTSWDGKVEVSKKPLIR